jgi:hypothetical protein
MYKYCVYCVYVYIILLLQVNAVITHVVTIKSTIPTTPPTHTSFFTSSSTSSTRSSEYSSTCLNAHVSPPSPPSPPSLNCYDTSPLPILYNLQLYPSPHSPFTSTEFQRESNILASTAGYKVPGTRWMHMDSMKVYSVNVRKLPGASSGSLSVRLGCMALRWGKGQGCDKVRFLAIDDEPRQHRRLVRYWRWLGLEEKGYVGDGVGDIKDRLVWGGRGRIMEGDIEELLRKWEGTWTGEGWEDLNRTIKK